MLSTPFASLWSFNPNRSHPQRMYRQFIKHRRVSGNICKTPQPLLWVVGGASNAAISTLASLWGHSHPSPSFGCSLLCNELGTCSPPPLLASQPSPPNENKQCHCQMNRKASISRIHLVGKGDLQEFPFHCPQKYFEIFQEAPKCILAGMYSEDWMLRRRSGEFFMFCPMNTFRLSQIVTFLF